MPEDGYGWEKLFSERMCRHFREDFGMQTRMARYHNIYGPHGTWDGGREKAPAAICRKVIEAKLSGRHEIEIWGDGEQTRSFTYIDDCLEGTQRLMHSDVAEALNLGSDQMVSINQLVDIVEQIAGVTLVRNVRPLGTEGRARCATATTTSSASASAGRQASGSRTAWRRSTPGSTTRSGAELPPKGHAPPRADAGALHTTRSSQISRQYA